MKRRFLFLLLVIFTITLSSFSVYTNSENSAIFDDLSENAIRLELVPADSQLILDKILQSRTKTNMSPEEANFIQRLLESYLNGDTIYHASAVLTNTNDDKKDNNDLFSTYVRKFTKYYSGLQNDAWGALFGWIAWEAKKRTFY